MKTQTQVKKENKHMTKLTKAHLFLNSIDFLILNKEKPKLDMRFNESKELLSTINSMKKTFNKNEAKLKLKNRRKQPLMF